MSYDYSFQDICYVFTGVRDFFHHVVNFFLFDDLYGIVAVAEKGLEAVPEQVVRYLFQVVDSVGVPADIFDPVITQVIYGRNNFQSACFDVFGEKLHVIIGFFNIEEFKPPGASFDNIQNIIQLDGQTQNVFTFQGGYKGLIQGQYYFVGILVPFVFKGFNPEGELLGAAQVINTFPENTGGGLDIVGYENEMFKKNFFAFFEEHSSHLPYNKVRSPLVSYHDPGQFIVKTVLIF
jgi:hypothetical protein